MRCEFRVLKRGLTLYNQNIKQSAILLAILFISATAIAETLRMNAGTIYYEVQGKGPAIVLLHGGFGDCRMWNGQFDALAENHQVVRYDQPGFGQSSKPEAAYSPVSVLLLLLDHLGIHKAYLIGNSMGGTLAIDFTLLHPDRIAGIVVVGSGPDGYPIPKEDQDKMNAVFSTAAQKGLPAAVELWLTNPMVAVAMSNAGTKELLSKMVNDNSSIFLMRFWPIEKMEPPGMRRLQEIKTPTLIIVGEKDTPLIRELAGAAASGISGAKQIVIQDADHLPQMERPAEFNKAVLDFLKGNS